MPGGERERRTNGVRERERGGVGERGKESRRETYPSRCKDL